ncbi:piRNA biogenesis protein EXD1-like [Neocloeon triangulifer]|uniref:piRNA biogenesis protein EXD1-like n=1 Tax=Neocloeon triangulifer TaxID=2078957 RepID=UPI00286F2F8D|nr:piRNA biogenesis protein EXD1-like [Neocloeon triangulifer]
MNTHFAIGEKLRIDLFDSADDHFVTGLFVTYNSNRTRITLDEATYHPSGSRLPNEAHFFAGEIKSVVSVDKSSENLPVAIDKDVGRSLASCKGPSHPHLTHMFQQPEIGQPNPDRKMRPEFERIRNKFEDYKVIDKKDEEFEQAIARIENCSEVGVSFEGELLGRSGRLCWINFSDGTTSFLFDIIALGLDEALVRILTCESLLKIMHDSRLAADCLVHNHQLNLVNTIDTQVFDLMILRARRDNCPSYATSLTDCLKRYLRLPEAVLLMPSTNEERIRDETAKWARRPLAESELDMAVQNVTFLRELHAEMHKSYMEPVRIGSNFYLNHVVSMTDKDARKYNALDHLTPRQLYWICRNRSAPVNTTTEDKSAD